MKTPILLALLILTSCGEVSTSHKTKKTNLKQTGEVNLILSGVADIKQLKLDAERNGITVEGTNLVFMKGDAAAINSLNIPANDNFSFMVDEAVSIQIPQGFAADQDALYLAKKDFGILEFWKTHPKADGRGVTVGVFDDGISPHQDGFKITSTGERKFLVKESQSSFTTFDLVETTDGFEASVDENRPTYVGTIDLDKNGKHEAYKILVNKDLDKATWLDQTRGSFSKTGEFFAAIDKRFSVMIEIDKEKKKLKVFQPEAGEDSHGEGVASVMAGFRIGNLEGFDGVAPGSKIVDFDLSEASDKMEEKEYTLSTFLKGLDWLGANGAEVVNVSYSIFFTSAEAQTFMRDALDEIIKKHNMVISFSAGNNGPGLGSLNRRSMYPESSLVAGAFISKELDERVWGATGIPDEGRVVYYSSRGPGQGTGPTLISPLSSLTNSSPDEGHRAFNGTSSASPALAGAAAVLVSAIKQEGLKVHAPSVVHALRLSGKRLKAEPFVFQGNGLPQIGEALSIYKKIINGDVFENVSIIVGRESIDRVESKGATIRTSQTGGTETRTIYLQGSASSIAPAEKKVNLLTPVRLKYSAGITGPRELWVSSAESALDIDIDVTALLKSDVEAFGEIVVISQQDNLPLATIPITIVRDVNVQAKPAYVAKLGAQEGKRFHLNVPEGVQAFRVISETVDNDNAIAQVSVFDTNQIRIRRVRSGGEIWVQVDRPGHYQIGFAQDRGTPRGTEIRVRIEPISLKLKTFQVSEADPQITITNRTKTPFFGVLKARKVDEVIKSQILGGEFKEPEFTVPLVKGSYKIAAASAAEHDLSYPYFNCSTSYTNEKGALVLGEAPDLEMSQDAEVRVRCMPFEYGMKKSNLRWLFQLLKVTPATSTRVDLGAGNQKSFKVNDLTKGQYVLEMEDPLLKDNIIKLGKLEVL